MTPTLDPSIAKPTLQQIFDAVVTHGARMPGTSTNPGPNGKCVYRTEDGTNACHIGGLLTDDEARRLDCGEGISGGTGLSHLLSEHPDLVPERFRHWELRHFLPRMQGVHDSHLGRDSWPTLWRNIAKDYLLDPSIIDRVFVPTLPRG